MEKSKVLVVDDDSLMRESITETVRRMGHDVDSASSGAEALGKLQDGDFNLVVSDLKMPGMTGLELLERVRQTDRDTPFIMITAHGTIDTAVDAMKKGAQDFITKGEMPISEIEARIQRGLQYGSLVTENRRLRSALQKKWRFVGSAPAMDEIKRLVEQVAQSKSTVIVSGESGTGKELIARSIHYLSPRQNGPFVKINCAAMPEGLIESELFGHEKGAFTGAIKRKLGKFEMASGGTLLLDEIGEMAAGVQAKLLRVLQEREVDKVGGSDPVEVDVRVVATTNRDLAEEVRAGRFREDLFYRLNVFHITLPSLRKRPTDIAALVDHFIQRYNEENGFTVEGVTPQALAMLEAYDWPGNIRELENAVERAVVLGRTGRLEPGVFSLRSIKETQASPGTGFAFVPGITVAQAEKELILQTLVHCSQNRTRAAEVLGISVRTLRNKLHEYGQTGEDDVADEE